MELLVILRTLSRRRLLVGLLAALSLIAGLLVAYEFDPPATLTSRQYTVGLSHSRILVDTPDSQVVGLYPPKSGGGAGTAPAPQDLVGRAGLLASLTATSQVKDAIAKKAGIAPEDLVVLATQAESGLAPTSLEAVEAKSIDDRKDNILRVRSEPELPLISVEAQSPSRATAVRLADAAAGGLRDFLGSVAATQDIPQPRQIVVRQLGAAQGGVMVHGPRRLYGVLLTIVLFSLACALIAAWPEIVRRWREVAERDGEMAVAVADEQADRKPGGHHKLLRGRTSSRSRDVEADLRTEQEPPDRIKTG